MESILFYMLACIALVGAVMAITRVSALATALWMALALVAIGGLMGLMGAALIALLHILLAAGAMMVLFVFVIMLTPAGTTASGSRGVRFGKVVAAAAVVYLAAIIAVALLAARGTGETAGDFSLSADVLSRMVVTDYAAAFLLISVVLLVAMIGTAVMGRRKP